MSLRHYLLGMFRGFSANGELEAVEDAAKADAQLVVGTYVAAFEAEASRLLNTSQQRFVSYDPNEIEGEIVPPFPDDWSAVDEDWTRQELMGEAKLRQIPYTRATTKDELLESLT